MSKSTDNNVSDRGANQNADDKTHQHQKSDSTQHNPPKDPDQVSDKKSSETKTTPIHANEDANHSLPKPATPIKPLEKTPS